MRGGLVYPKNTLYSSILSAGLSANLKLCLDVGDPASYPGSGQPWLDRSGGGYDFNMGATSSAEASDPTFNGVAGRHADDTYWSFDGGDAFTYDSANETWMNALHQDNAVFTVFALTYLSAAGTAPLFGDNGGASTTTGLYLNYDNASMGIFISKSVAGTPALNKATDAGVTRSVWSAIGLSLNEAGGNVSFFWKNGAFMTVGGSNTFDAAYSAPSAGAASNTFQICGYGGGGASSPVPSGFRIACFALWSGALTKANLDTLFADQRRRVGI